MQEHRRTSRTRVLKDAKLFFKHRYAVIDCTVRNLSISGACLEVSAPVAIPDAFELSFDSFRSVRLCQVRWRAESTIGVSFG